MAFDDYTKSNVKSLYQRWYGIKTSATAPTFSPITTNSGGVYVKASTDSITGKKNPWYRQQIRDVLSATTPCTGTLTSLRVRQHPYCTLNWVYAKGNPLAEARLDNYTYGFVPNVCSILESYLNDASVLTSTENRAIQLLYAQLNGFASSVKSGEDVGEYKQTLRAIRRPLGPLRKVLVSAFEGGRQAFSRRGAVNIAKAAADTWLQFQFGINPLTRTVADATVGLQNKDVLFNYRPFHATAEAVIGSPNNFLDCDIPTSNIAVDGLCIRKTHYQVTFQGVWAEECQVPKRSVDNVLGWEARDVLPTIWNLIPYSFLVDYFVNVGDIVGALAVPWGGVRWCNKTVRTSYKNSAQQHYKMNLTASDKLNATYLQWHPIDGIIDHTRTTFVRSVQSTLPLPTLELTSPLDLSQKRWFNLAALCVTMARGQTKSVQRAVSRYPELPSLFSREMAYRGFRALKNQ